MYIVYIKCKKAFPFACTSDGLARKLEILIKRIKVNSCTIVLSYASMATAFIKRLTTQ